MGDALGNPTRFLLTGGDRADCKQALALLENQTADAVLGDKGYDAGYIVEAVRAMGAEAVIPSRINSKNPREYDSVLYEERNNIERLFNRMKHYRRVSTRYDKLSASYLSFVQLAAICLWLK